MNERSSFRVGWQVTSSSVFQALDDGLVVRVIEARQLHRRLALGYEWLGNVGEGVVATYSFATAIVTNDYSQWSIELHY